MNERLKAILLLPFSRKVIVGLAAGALAYANKHLDLGLSDDVVKFLVASACFVILGISIEDGAKTLGDAHVEAMSQAPAPSVTQTTTTTVEDQKP